MTTPEVLPHVEAIRAALEAASLPTYIGGAAPGPGELPKTYVVLYPDPGIVRPASLADDRTGLDAVVQLTCVGTTAEGAIGTADRAARVLDVPLAVAGRATWRPERLGGPPLQRDDDLVPPAFFLPVQYRISSIPA